jgi:hypothetical protein
MFTKSILDGTRNNRDEWEQAMPATEAEWLDIVRGAVVAAQITNRETFNGERSGHDPAECMKTWLWWLRHQRPAVCRALGVPPLDPDCLCKRCEKERNG